MLHGSDKWQVGFRSLGQKVASTSGIFGAYPANSHLQGFIFRSATSGPSLTKGELNQFLDVAVEDILKLPGAKVVPPMCPSTVLSEGDAYVQCWPGGGGLGDPLQRDPNMVLNDFGIGKISTAVAREIYGVVVRGDQIDYEATRALRQDIKNARKARCTIIPQQSEKEARGMACLNCGFIPEGPLPFADRKPRDVMHFWVDDDWMFYREYYCPRCWSLVRVDPMSPKDSGYSFF